MTSLLRASLFFAFVPFAGCITYEESVPPLGAEDHVLAERTDPSGRQQTFTLHVVASTGDAKLRVATATSRERSDLGIRVKELDKKRAEDRGVEPFSGLLVTAVADDAGRSDAHFEVGDVLRSIGGRDVVYPKQFAAIEADLAPNAAVDVTVLRGQKEIGLSLTPRMHRVVDRFEEDVPLVEAPVSHAPYAGVTVRGIPEEWCKKVWDEPRNGVVVTSVVTGSPAWVAGVRGGDLIETLDGAPVPPVADVTRAIAERGPMGGVMQWRVRRGDQVHDAAIELADYSGESNVWVPLVFRTRNGVYEDAWSVGPFGLLLRNRNTWIADQTTREPQTRNVFSALIGLFQVESLPRETRIRLLWIVTIDT